MCVPTPLPPFLLPFALRVPLPYRTASGAGARVPVCRRRGARGPPPRPLPTVAPTRVPTVHSLPPSLLLPLPVSLLYTHSPPPYCCPYPCPYCTLARFFSSRPCAGSSGAEWAETRVEAAAAAGLRSCLTRRVQLVREGGTRRVQLVREGGTRRVQLVREGGGGGCGAARGCAPWRRSPLTRRRALSRGAARLVNFWCSKVDLRAAAQGESGAFTLLATAKADGAPRPSPRRALTLSSRASLSPVPEGEGPGPAPRTNRTRRVLHPVLIGHVRTGALSRARTTPLPATAPLSQRGPLPLPPSY